MTLANPAGRDFVRLIEAPLGDDAAERPTHEAVAAMWAEAVRLPIPDYPGTLRRFVFGGSA